MEVFLFQLSSEIRTSWSEVSAFVSSVNLGFQCQLFETRLGEALCVMVFDERSVWLGSAQRDPEVKV